MRPQLEVNPGKVKSKHMLGKHIPKANMKSSEARVAKKKFIFEQAKFPFPSSKPSRNKGPRDAGMQGASIDSIFFRSTFGQEHLGISHP